MNITLASVRVAATGIVTGLAVLTQYYPHEVWIPAAIAMAGAIGVHAVPSVGQKVAAVSFSDQPQTWGTLSSTTSIRVPPAPSVSTQEVPDMTESAPEVAPELAKPVGAAGISLMGLSAPVPSVETADVTVFPAQHPAHTDDPAVAGPVPAVAEPVPVMAAPVPDAKTILADVISGLQKLQGLL